MPTKVVKRIFSNISGPVYGINLKKRSVEGDVKKKGAMGILVLMLKLSKIIDRNFSNGIKFYFSG